MQKKELEKSMKEETAGTSQASSSYEPFFDVGPEIGQMNEPRSSSALIDVSFHPIESDDTAPTSSSVPDEASAIANVSSSSTISDASSKRVIQVVVENLTVAELWGQYVKCLMMSTPSNVGRVEIERSTGKHAEKYLEQILKLSPISSRGNIEPLRVPCFDPNEQREISVDEKYKVEILKATKADSELIWNIAAQSQALVLIRRSIGPAVGLDQLNKFNSALQEAADAYRESISSSQDRSVSRVGKFQYRISYGGKTENYHVDVMRNLILNQLPPSVRFFTGQTKSERLRDVLHEMGQKRTRKQ